MGITGKAFRTGATLSLLIAGFAALPAGALAGDGTFTADLRDSALGNGPWATAIGDLNGDGRKDLAVANLYDDDVSIRLGAGDGTFTSDRPDVGVGDGPQAIALGDLNGDGREDLAVANAYADGVSIRLGAGDGTFTSDRPHVGVGDGPRAIALGDLNGDGNDDLAVANTDDDDVSIRLGAGDGTFTSDRPDVGVGDDPRAIALGDLNGDGNDDLAVANTEDADVSIRFGAGAPTLAGNLLVNGGFEGPGAAPLYTQSPEIPGWSRTGGMMYARYGIAQSYVFPTHLDSPRFASGGLNFLAGGNSAATGGTTTAFQTVDVAQFAGAIDAGNGTVNLSAYLGGGNVFDDRMSATAAFLDGSGADLGAFEIGPVTNADRKNLTTLLRRSGNSAAPVGTRQIRVTLTSIDADASYSSAFADNVKLTLSGEGLPRDPVDPGGAPGGAPADSELEFELSGKRKQKVLKQKGVIVEAECPQEACTADATGTGKLRKPKAGRTALAKLKLKPVTEELAAGATEKLKLKLKKKQRARLKAAIANGRKPKLRVIAEAVDAAGNRSAGSLKVTGK